MKPEDKMFSFELDEITGLLHAKAVGFWTADQAHAYAAELQLLLDNCRRRFGRVYLLVDATETQVQSQDVIDIFAGLDEKIIRSPKDRAATLAKSSLSKMQMQRSYTSAQVQAFLSRDVALKWLFADTATP